MWNQKDQGQGNIGDVKAKSGELRGKGKRRKETRELVKEEKVIIKLN